MSNQVAVVAAISEHLGKEKHDALTKHIDLQVTYIDIQAFVDHKECGASMERNAIHVPSLKDCMRG